MYSCEKGHPSAIKFLMICQAVALLIHDFICEIKVIGYFYPLSIE